MKVKGWDCADGTPDEDHDWEYVSDWYGDPGVIGGTADCSFKRCKQCGEERPLEIGEGYPEKAWRHTYRWRREACRRALTAKISSFSRSSALPAARRSWWNPLLRTETKLES